METRACTSCKGSGTSCYNDKLPCVYCAGRSVFDRPDRLAILEALKPKRGKNLGGVKVVAPAWKRDDRQSCRIYFVWRQFRSKAFLDTARTFTADVLISGDPWQHELLDLAQALAEHHIRKEGEAHVATR